MLYAMSFLFLFTIGGLTGIMVGVLSVDVHLHDTYFVVAHFHYVMMGGMMIALLGGMHYWWPKMTGKMYHELTGKIGAALIFIGFNVAFFVQFILGSQGMPRRYYDYPAGYETLHQVSTVGSWILALGLFSILGNAIWSIWKGPKAPANPWAAATLEWTNTTSPPDPHNFHHTPLVTRGPYDYHLADEVFGGPGGDGYSGDGARVPEPPEPEPAAAQS